MEVAEGVFTVWPFCEVSPLGALGSVRRCWHYGGGDVAGQMGGGLSWVL